MFFIQNSISNNKTIHESLIDASNGAIIGGGMYAFATKGGIELLFEDKEFVKMLNVGSFHLIVGVDQITNTKSLDTLRYYESRYCNLTVHVFNNNNKGLIFHPKFSWFRSHTGGTTVLGSGNLTMRGLRNNYEAFNINEHSLIDAHATENQWNDWINVHSAYLKPLHDFNIIQKAKKNDVWGGSGYSRTLNTVNKEMNEEDLIPWSSPIGEVLIAQVPQSGDRWKQVNFSKDNFENYFGAVAGINGSYRVLLKNILDTGELCETEIRPSVSVLSKNYRFEIGAATGKLYPMSGIPPVIAFIKVAPRMFVYILTLPGDTNFLTLNQFVTTHGQPRISGRMQRIVINNNIARQQLPSLPFWKL